jgi:hypothetical protein
MKHILLVSAFLIFCSGILAQESTTAPQSINSTGGPNMPSTPPFKSIVQKGQQTNGYVRPNAATRRKRFINSMVGPWALGRTVATAGISTWRNSPEEWGDKWEGFGRRVASNFGRNVIKQTTKFGIDEALKTDSHFYRSKNKSVSARIGNALISPVTARDRNGNRVIGVANLAGTYGASIISREVWYPDRYDWKDGVKSGTISLGFNAAFNLVKEFIWKK